MSKLIALVATAVIVNGERTVIQPGQELPELPEHDAQTLQASGAASDPAKDKAAAKAHDAAEAKGAEEFAAARAAVQAQQDSIKPDAATATKTPATKRASR